MQDDEKKLLKQIHDYEMHITKYRQKLNIEGAIIFVTSVSILGITEYPLMQLFAIVLVAFLLVYKIYEYLKSTGDTRTFPEIHDNILKQIDKKNNLAKYYLGLVQYEKMNIITIFSIKGDGFVFMSSVFYYAFTVFSVLKDYL
jgi:hypothetical protein